MDTSRIVPLSRICFHMQAIPTLVALPDPCDYSSSSSLRSHKRQGQCRSKEWRPLCLAQNRGKSSEGLREYRFFSRNPACLCTVRSSSAPVVSSALPWDIWRSELYNQHTPQLFVMRKACLCYQSATDNFVVVDKQIKILLRVRTHKSLEYGHWSILLLTSYVAFNLFVCHKFDGRFGCNFQNINSISAPQTTPSAFL